MRTRWLIAGLMCWIAVAPAPGSAQQTERDLREAKREAKRLIKDAAKELLGPRWMVYAQGGLSTQGRLLLQHMGSSAVVGQRSLQGNTGFNIGGGAAVDFLLKSGLRASYTYSSTSLSFKEDDGDGSHVLDVDDVGKLRSNTVALEVVRYMLPHMVKFTPYGSVGVVGTWYVLDEQSDLVQATGGGTQFRLGAIGSVGMRAKVNKRFDVRLEAASASVRNPFAGRSSFRALSGLTIDEPTRVGSTDFRLAVAYSFGHEKKHHDTSKNPTAKK